MVNGHVEWFETEREAVERGLRRYGFNAVAASIARQVLDDLAPFVAARENQAHAEGEREAKAAAWDAGFHAGHEAARAVNPEWPNMPTNPYLKGAKSVIVSREEGK